MKPHLTLLFIVAISLSSCENVYETNVTNVNGRITFTFQKGLFRKDFAPCIEFLHVYIDGVENPIWEIDSNDKSSCTRIWSVAYGNLPFGFKENVRASHLEQNKIYRVDSEGISGNSRKLFSVNSKNSYWAVSQ